MNSRQLARVTAADSGIAMEAAGDPMDTWKQYFRVGVDVAFDRGEVWTTKDFAGACLFFAPNKWQISIWTELKAAYRLARL